MAEHRITVRVRFAWWLWPYLRSVALFAWMTGLEPDFDKVERMIRRAMRTHIEASK